MTTHRFIPLGLAALLAAGAAHGAGDPAAGKEKAAQCQSCHGLDGNSTDPQYPRLAGQHADYIMRSLEGYKTGRRSNPIMQGFAQGLSEQDRADLAAWFSQQEGLATPEAPDRVQP